MDNSKNNTTLKTYLDEIRRYSLLDFEQEKELSRRILAGDPSAEAELINANLRLVVKIARGYVNSDMGLMDLIQEGNMGLIRAASKYDYRKNVRFSTYSSWWIRQSISRAIMNKQRTIRLPHRKEETLRRIQQTVERFNMEYMRHPSMDEIRERTGIEEEEIRYIMDITDCSISLDTEINCDNGTLMDLLEDETFTPDQELINKCIKEDTARCLNQLPEREKNILMYRFSFLGGEKYTLKQISEFMGISPETVRQIEIRALKKLKTSAVEIKDYLYAS
jgi:RNA polymerase primary sigma factor